MALYLPYDVNKNVYEYNLYFNMSKFWGGYMLSNSWIGTPTMSFLNKED